MIKCCLVFFLVNDFIILFFMVVIEVLCIVNCMLGYQVYKWCLVFVDGEKVFFFSGIEIVVQMLFVQECCMFLGVDCFFMVIICFGIDVEYFSNKVVYVWLCEVYNCNVQIGSFCMGVYILVQVGFLNGKCCVIYWENLFGFLEVFLEVEVYVDFYEVDGNIYICVGGMVFFDMMLNLIGQDFDDNFVNWICEQVFIDCVCEQLDCQCLFLCVCFGVQNFKVFLIIEVMEKNFVELLLLFEIVDDVGLLCWQIECFFCQEMGCLFVCYYLEIWLECVCYFFVQFMFLVVEVVVVCGFVFVLYFLKCYCEIYNCLFQQECVECCMCQVV